jgi:hypothetical protein
MARKRTLDALDPPVWGPAPPDATTLVRRCHELRQKAVDSFTVEDLRIMISQQIGLQHLVPLALARLAEDPLADGDYYAGDLLASVRRVPSDFWEQHPKLARELSAIVEP